MALSLIHANRILEKARLAITIRPATRREACPNEYGEKGAYVFDQGEWQARKTYPTLAAAIAAALEQGWEAFDAAQLTEVEKRELRSIPSNVARLI